MRKNSYLLDWCFNWLSLDPVTKGIYGDKEKEAIKKWFLNTKFFISPSTMREDEIRFPMVTIHLESSSEAESTLGDVHFETHEELPSEEMLVQPQIILGPFTPKTYNASTGLIELPDNLSTENVLTDQILVDNANKQGYIIKSIDSSNSFSIEPNTSANFINAYIAPLSTFTTVALESVLMKQVFAINCYIQNEPRYIMYLSTIVRFILYRYKELLLENRGFERSVLSMTGPFLANSRFQAPEGEEIFGQDFKLTGFVREYWPKMISPKIQGIKINGLEYMGGTQTPDSVLNQVEEQGWWQENDPLPE